MWNDDVKRWIQALRIFTIFDTHRGPGFLYILSASFWMFFHLQCYSSSRYRIWPVWSTMNPRLLGFWAGPNVNYRKFIWLKTRNPWWCPPLWAHDLSISFWLNQLTSPFFLAYIKLHPYFSAGEIIKNISNCIELYYIQYHVYIYNIYIYISYMCI